MLPDSKQPIFEARLVFPVGEAETGGGKPGVAIAAAGLLWHDFQSWFTETERQVMGWVVRLGAPVAWAVTDHTAFRVRGFSLFADGHLWRLHWLLANGRYESLDVSHMQDLVARDEAHRDRGPASSPTGSRRWSPTSCRSMRSRPCRRRSHRPRSTPRGR
jgi:hypothetical protein